MGLRFLVSPDPVVGKSFSFTLEIKGLDDEGKPFADDGELFEVFAQKGVISFDAHEAHVRMKPGKYPSGEVSFVSEQGFLKAGTFTIKVCSVTNPIKCASLEVTVAAAPEQKPEPKNVDPTPIKKPDQVNTKPVEGEVENKENVKPVPVEPATPTPNTYAFGKLLLIVAVVLYLAFLAFVYHSPTQPKTIEKVVQVPSAEEQAPQPETPPVAVEPSVAPTPAAVEEPKAEEPEEESKTEEPKKKKSTAVWVEVD